MTFRAYTRLDFGVLSAPFLMCRGEALSCICELSGAFTVLTRHKTMDIGAAIQYNANGTIAQQREQARPVGTTILISTLFEVGRCETVSFPALAGEKEGIHPIRQNATVEHDHACSGTLQLREWTVVVCH